MIIISRLAGESVVVGDELTVTVVQVDGDEVILHIDAPGEVALERGENLAALPAHGDSYDGDDSCESL